MPFMHKINREHAKGDSMSIDRYERMNQERRNPQGKKRVAAYCRVSTDNQDQANSFDSQQRFFRQYIQRHPDWDLFEIFADEGLSGTTTRKRKSFNRMIQSFNSSSAFLKVLFADSYVKLIHGLVIIVNGQFGGH